MEVNRGLPAPLLVEYFEQSGTEWSIQPAIRRTVRFEPLNLVGPWPVRDPFDIILPRNGMIYFDPETRRSTLNRIAGALAPEGYLLMGTAETAVTLSDRFVPEPVGRTVVYRCRR